MRQTGCSGGRLLCGRPVVVESLVVVASVVVTCLRVFRGYTTGGALAATDGGAKGRRRTLGFVRNKVERVAAIFANPAKFCQILLNSTKFCQYRNRLRFFFLY